MGVELGGGLLLKHHCTMYRVYIIELLCLLFPKASSPALGDALELREAFNLVFPIPADRKHLQSINCSSKVTGK